MKQVGHSKRKLSLLEKTDLLIRDFGINESTIRFIRSRNDVKSRLMEAAKVQIEIFGNMHNDLTAWLAGYASESTVRKTFGSSRILREELMPETIPENAKDFTFIDIYRKVKVPDEITPQVAEETGIHIGDGNLCIVQDNRGSHEGHSYRYRITGDLINEIIYHEEHIRSLLTKVYNFPGYISKQPKKHSITTSLNSKAVVHFKKNTLGLPIGPKKLITIPSVIENEKELLKYCIKGIIDTDFTVTNDMQSVGNLASFKLIEQLGRSLKTLNINHRISRVDNCGRITIYKRDAQKIFEDWGLSNPKHSTKYEICKEFKKYLPFTTTFERLALIESKTSISELEKLGEERRHSNIFKGPVVSVR